MNTPKPIPFKKKKHKAIAGSNFAFTLYIDGSADFRLGLNPTEIVELNKEQMMDVYDVVAKFYGHATLDEY